VRLIYYGTPEHAVEPLRHLVETGRAPLLVVTRPDRPRGRGLTLRPSPVRALATSLRLPVFTPARASEAASVERVRSLAPDILVVVAYGQILSPELLAVPRLGALNVHFSLLPLHRGAAPVSAALLAGDEETGVSTMWMTERLDEGPVFLRRATPIGPHDDAGALGERLTSLGADLLIESLARLERGDAVREEQDHARATYAPKLRTAEGRLSLTEPAAALVRRVRAYSPAPGAWLDLERGRLGVLAATSDDAPGGVPGIVAGIDRARGLGLACGRGVLWLARVRPAGRNEMSGAAYANGARLTVGAEIATRTADA